LPELLLEVDEPLVDDVLVELDELDEPDDELLLEELDELDELPVLEEVVPLLEELLVLDAPVQPLVDPWPLDEVDEVDPPASSFTSSPTDFTGSPGSAAQACAPPAEARIATTAYNQRAMGGAPPARIDHTPRPEHLRGLARGVGARRRSNRDAARNAGPARSTGSGVIRTCPEC
jgi:hypothetical protein